MPEEKKESGVINGHLISGEGEYIWIDLPEGGQIQINIGGEGPIIDIFSANEDETNSVATCAAMYSELEKE